MQVYLPIYLALIFGCFTISFLKRKKNSFPLYIYFIIVFMIELFVVKYRGAIANTVYAYASLFYMAFFTLYYSKEAQRIKKIIFSLGAFAIIAALIIIFYSSKTFPIFLGIIVSLLYISFSLLWFFRQIKYSEPIFIAKKEAFWISAGLLFWSIIFIFRVSMMYWLAENDPKFLLILHQIFVVAVILTHISFLVAVTRKSIQAT